MVDRNVAKKMSNEMPPGRMPIYLGFKSLLRAHLAGLTILYKVVFLFAIVIVALFTSYNVMLLCALLL